MSDRIPYTLDFENGSIVNDILKKAQQLPDKAGLDLSLESKADKTRVDEEVTNLQTQINNIVRAPESGGDVGAEVYQARVNAHGEEYLTLKSRLDADEDVADYAAGEVDAAKEDVGGTIHSTLKDRLDSETNMLASDINTTEYNILVHSGMSRELSESDFISGKYTTDMRITNDNTYIAIKSPVICNAGDKIDITTGTYTKKVSVQVFSLEGEYQSNTTITNDSSVFTCEEDCYIVILGRYDSSTTITPSNYDADITIHTQVDLRFLDIEDTLSAQGQLIKDVFEDVKKISGYDVLNTTNVSASSEYLIYPYDMSNAVISKIHINVNTVGKITFGVIDKQYVTVGSPAATDDKYIILKTMDIESTGELTIDFNLRLPDNSMLWIKSDTDTLVWKIGTKGRDKGFIYNDNGNYKYVANYSLGIDWYIQEVKSSDYKPYIIDNQQGILSKWFKPEELLVDTEYIPDYVELTQPFGLIGRWYEKEINSENCFFTTASGSEIYFKTVGASQITLQFIDTMGTHVYYAISIDGGMIERRLQTDAVITLPDDGIHLIRIITDGLDDTMNRWSGQYGYAFKGATIDDGVIVGILPRNPIIAFYGDSITEGLRALGASTGVSDLGDVNSATKAFPYFCCEQLNAISYRCGYGASGITVNGSFHKTIDAINYYAQDVPVDTFYPQMIVLNVGTNDYIHSVSGSTFKTGYIAVVERLHILYPNANILCMVPFNQYYTTEIEQVVSAHSYCKLVGTSGWNIDKVDDYHPSAAGALSAGTQLAAVIKSLIY